MDELHQDRRSRPMKNGRLMTDKAREERARAKLQRLGYRLLKSRVRSPHLNNQGGYQIVEASINGVVAGSDYDLSLGDVEEWLEE